MVPIGSPYKLSSVEQLNFLFSTISNRPAGSLDGPSNWAQITLKGTNFPLLIGSQNQNQDEIRENSKEWN